MSIFKVDLKLLRLSLYKNVTIAECGGILTQERGVIASPNYGANENYPDNLDCIWTLKAREGSVIKVLLFELILIVTCLKYHSFHRSR